MEIVYIIIGAVIGYGLYSLKNKLNKPPRPKPAYEIFEVNPPPDDKKGFPLANIFITILIIVFVVAIISNM